MSRLFSSETVVSLGVVGFGLLALFGPSLPFAMSLLVLIVGIVICAVVLGQWGEPTPIVRREAASVPVPGSSQDGAPTSSSRLTGGSRSARILAMSIACIVFSTPLISAQDLSKYRDFRLGMSLGTVARQAGITPEARILHQRPELIQELMWQPPRVPGSVPRGDAVRTVLFSFYNDQLFRMAVTYDQDKTEGLTAEDLVEAVSSTYGLATLRATEIVRRVPPVSPPNDKILGNWEDTEYSLSLFRSSYLSTFGLVVLSKPLDALARIAIVEAVLLDKQEAPQRELDRQQQLTDENRVKQEAARRVNKSTFRP